ncbi:MAG: desulfoferrodoxin [Lentisphaerae bacterium]|jgi:superoxide reductase|nr:desulfoferrodoxin [Lentisphaerota bacterium]MBT4821652.1 desulfoferrodoxin [Lentisphaerota bacterium]MBT5612904.1 desulfoferrodoxin [Lentisphaerota bacterium]MBT7060950.1 desulfoferrodoxin [Lentisphaerota bacterium]MBT7846975.1 desulfoferrodoxin [Lentisphaerota bacterium]
MITQKQVYECGHCGNQIEVLRGGGPVPECCGEAMALLDEKTADAATEKHVPVIEKVDGGYKVTVGSVPHPMADDHYIEWIELSCGDVVSRAYMKPGEKPEAFFCCCCACECQPPTAREHCNKHGLWKA